MSYFRHWKSTHNERKQVEKAKEQGAHVRRKRGLRRLPDDYDDKASSNYDDRNWKTQSKRRKQFREGLIEAIVEGAYTPRSNKEGYKIPVWCPIHGRVEIPVPDINYGVWNRVKVSCSFCKEALHGAILNTHTHNDVEKMRLSGKCPFCGGPTPCLRDD